MSAFWEKKMARHFKLFDLNSDGIIEKDEFVQLAKNISDSQHKDARYKEELVKAFEDTWPFWTVTSTGDGKTNLTPEKFIESMRIQLNDPDRNYQKVVVDLILGIFPLMDLNEDGYIQEDEHKAYFFNLGMADDGWTKKAFRALDVDNKGRITREQFATGYFDFVYSQDENNHNNMFFGPLDP